MSFHALKTPHRETDREQHARLVNEYAQDVDSTGNRIDATHECVNKGPGKKAASVTYLKSIGAAGTALVARHEADVDYYNANLPEDEKGDPLPQKTAAIVAADLA